MRDTHAGDDRRITEDGRYLREVVEQPHSCAEQHGSQIDLDLVEQPCVQALLDRLGRSTATDFGPAADLALATALSIPSVTNWTVEPGRGQPSGTWWVTTNAGTSHGC